jgi:hypothetical protein
VAHKVPSAVVVSLRYLSIKVWCCEAFAFRNGDHSEVHPCAYHSERVGTMPAGAQMHEILEEDGGMASEILMQGREVVTTPKFRGKQKERTKVVSARRAR